MVNTNQTMIKTGLPPRFTLYYDGACPLCRKEVNWLKKRCSKKGYSLAFTDISDPQFNPEALGKKLDTLMSALHLRDTTKDAWWVGMDATRVIYREIGLGWLMAPTGWPLLKPLFDILYATFAKVRPRLQKAPCDRCVR